MPDFKGLLAKHKQLFDIVVKGNDIILVFHNDVDRKLASTLKPLGVIRAITLSEMIARMRNLLEYRSTRHGKMLFNTLGLDKRIILSYDLKSLEHSKKTLFGYALKGRSKGLGLLGDIKGDIVGRNSIIFPHQGLSQVESFMDYWKVSYERQEVYVNTK